MSLHGLSSIELRIMLTKMVAIMNVWNIQNGLAICPCMLTNFSVLFCNHELQWNLEIKNRGHNGGSCG